MAVKIEVREASFTPGGAFSDPAVCWFPGLAFGVGSQYSLKSKNPSRSVLSRTGSPPCCVRKPARRDIGTALPSDVASNPSDSSARHGGGILFGRWDQPGWSLNARPSLVGNRRRDIRVFLIHRRPCPLWTRAFPEITKMRAVSHVRHFLCKSQSTA